MSVQNNIAPTSELAVKSDYHLFKQGVRPEWEDPQNKHGGKWAYQFKDKKAVNIDTLWLHVMLAAIGETLRALTAWDVRAACDIMRPAYDVSGGRDGRVSIVTDWPPESTSVTLYAKLIDITRVRSG